MAKNRAVFPGQFRGNHNSLFSPGPNGWLNACVGRNGGYAGLARYASGYFEAGERLVKSLHEDRFHVDSVIYPLVLVYRQGVETSLKHLVVLLSHLNDKPESYKLTHAIMDNWQIVRKHLVELEAETDDLDRVEKTLTDLTEIDATGETFRYPVDRKGKRHLEDMTHINVDVFASGMDSLKQFLEACTYWASEMLEQKMEMEREFASDFSYDGP